MVLTVTVAQGMHFAALTSCSCLLRLGHPCRLNMSHLIDWSRHSFWYAEVLDYWISDDSIAGMSAAHRSIRKDSAQHANQTHNP